MLVLSYRPAYFLCRTYRNDMAAVKPDRAAAELRNLARGVGYQQDGRATAHKFQHTRLAFLLKSGVAHRQNFIHDQHVWLTTVAMENASRVTIPVE